MKLKMKFAILALLFFCGQAVFSQTKTIQGVVSDKSGLPLTGVSVKVQGESGEAVTDFDGKYSINAASDNKLVFAFIGMSTQVVSVGTNTSINITLQDSTQDLKEVIVVAYGTQKRGNVTGAISTVSSKDIVAVPITNAESALQGRAAGVTVISSGAPGSNPSVTIRGLGSIGSNDPIYVIDGVISSSLAGISPNDIDNMSVLKDASTIALYGSQGSNGVILVTTKKGKKGAGQLTFSTYTGMQSVTKRFDVLNTDQYLKYAADAFGQANIARPAEMFKNNVNYQDEIFRTGLMTDYNLSYSAGTDNSTSRFSAEYLNQEGALINTGYKRYTFRAVNSYTVGKLTLGSNMAVNFSVRNPEQGSGGRTLLEHAIKAAPYLPVYNSSNPGGYQGPNSTTDGQDAENPVRAQSIGYRINKSVGVTGNLYGEYSILDGLKFRSQVSLNYYNNNNRTFTPSYDDDNIGATHSQLFSTTTRFYQTGQTIMFNNAFTYTKTFFDKHNIDLVGLIETYNFKGEDTNAESRYTISNEIDQLNNADVQALNSSSYEDKKYAYVARLNYNYDEKYLLALSARRDASSRFGSNYRSGDFYSIALGWNIAKESFLADTDISTLKLRGSYGTAGSDLNAARYQYSATLGSNYNYVIDNSAAVGVTAGSLANPDLKWEEKIMSNIGLDFGILGNKITGTVEYYNNNNEDQLSAVPLPGSLGTISGVKYLNASSVETKGMEFTLGYNDNEGDFKWGVTANLGTSKNKVTALAPGLDVILGQGSFRAGETNTSQTTVGLPMFYFYGLVADGVYNNQAEVDAVFYNNKSQTIVQPGDIRFKDLNNDGNIDSKDRTMIGNPMPEMTYGVNANLSYKNFDFNMFISGVHGNDIFNTNRYDLESMPRLFNAGTAVLDRAIVVGGVVQNPGTSVPRAIGAPQNRGVSSRFVEDGSFTRLKNITLGYTFNESVIAKYFSKLRLYVSAQNLITITDYSGLDPEIGKGDPTIVGGSNYDMGVDRGIYPQPKSVIVGLEVSF
jgi:TonB-linked SusC/RagA family outer membrane protein